MHSVQSGVRSRRSRRRCTAPSGSRVVADREQRVRAAREVAGGRDRRRPPAPCGTSGRCPGRSSTSGRSGTARTRRCRGRTPAATPYSTFRPSAGGVYWFCCVSNRPIARLTSSQRKVVARNVPPHRPWSGGSTSKPCEKTVSRMSRPSNPRCDLVGGDRLPRRRVGGLQRRGRLAKGAPPRRSAAPRAAANCSDAGRLRRAGRYCACLAAAAASRTFTVPSFLIGMGVPAACAGTVTTSASTAVGDSYARATDHGLVQLFLPCGN